MSCDDPGAVFPSFGIMQELYRGISFAMSHDDMQRRCPRLGDLINFSYCRTCGEGHQPCFKVFDCWWEYFDVVAYFRNTLSTEAFERLRALRAPDKMTSLVDLIEQARQRIQ